MKIAQIRSVFWSVFSRNWTEYGPEKIPYLYLSVFSPIKGKYGPEKTPYLDTFHVVGETIKRLKINHKEPALSNQKLILMIKKGKKKFLFT